MAGMKALRLVIFGPPGSGKGTQSKLISELYGIPHISTGDIFRDEMARGSRLGRLAEEYISKGLLVPDEVVVEMVRERLLREDCKPGFILDGFPRTLRQAEELDRILEELGGRLDAVINLVVDEEEVVRRITLRRVCSVCGAIYHLEFNPPKRPGVCDRCGGKLYQREDDTEEVVRKRLEVYRTQTEPILRYYREKGLVRDVDGNPSIEEVFEQVKAVLEEVRSGGDG